jgi:hypothetical protein
MGVRPSRPAALVLACVLAAACAGPSGEGTGRTGVAPASGLEAPAAVLGRFVAALEAGRWAQANELLSMRWRSAYTPARLAADYAGAGPVGREAAGRVRAALRSGTPFQVGDGRAALPLAGGRALLVAEAGGWRVDALE